MAELLDAIKGAVNSVACAGLSGGGWIAGILSGGGLPLEGIQDAIARAEINHCSGNPDNIPTVGSPPQFEGGQCGNLRYRVSFDYSYPNTSGGTSSGSHEFRFLFGAIGGVSYGGASNGRPLFVCSYLSGAEESGFVATALIATGQTPSITNVVVLPESGEDNCGNLPTQPPTPLSGHSEIIPRIDYEDKSGNPLSINDAPIEFFPPCINLDGVRIPFEVDLGFTKMCGKIGLRSDIKVGLEPDIDIDECPSQKEKNGIPEKDLSDFFELSEWIGSSLPEQSLSGSLSGSLPPGSPPILGVFVNSQRIPGPDRNSIILPIDSQNPALLIPRIGFVQFELMTPAEGGTETSFSERIDIRYASQFVPCPWQFGASSVRVEWESGWSGGYKIASRKTCCESCANNDPNEGLDNWDRCRID